VFILEEPQYHRVRAGEVNRFRGVALGAERVTFVRNGQTIAEATVDQSCPELAWLVHVPQATTSRFVAEVHVEPHDTIEIIANGVTQFVYDLHDEERLTTLWECVTKLPVPPPEIVATTQGGGDVESYRDAILTSVTTPDVLLRDSGVDLAKVRDVLDVGCGTGRILAGLHCDSSSRRLVGTDINAELIAWNEANLPQVAEWHVTGLYPPLDFPDATFDLIIFASVLTHLPLDCQEAWMRETLRLLRKGGAAIVTLHGETHASLLLDAATYAQWQQEGHIAFAAAEEGANAYSTFHTPERARALFREFASVRLHPRGDVHRGLFPFGGVQDVWVLVAP
jgi:ubiquinone/menaquinone biosynthesis C-methylase UbiE